MNRIATLLTICMLAMLSMPLFSCNGEGKAEYGIYGDSSITAEGTVSIGEIPSLLNKKDSIYIKAKGPIKAVCQKKGCWMQMDINEKESMIVRFKDYGFFVPMDASGKEAIIEGFAYVDTTSVAELRHLAKDAEKTEEEIMAITEPKVSFNFEASGVIIQ